MNTGRFIIIVSRLSRNQSVYSSYYSNNDNKSQTSVTTAIPQPNTAIIPTSQKLLLDLDHEKIKESIKSKAQGVEIKNISTGLMLAQCYNSDSESDEDGTETKSKSPKIGLYILYARNEWP